MQNASVSRLLEKMNNLDSDIRFMGLNDLHNLVSPSMSEKAHNASVSTIGMSADTFCALLDFEQRLLPKLVDCLGDSNGEVQNVAMKTLSCVILLIRVEEVERVTTALCKKLTGKDEKARDIAALCLRTITLKLFQESHSKSVADCFLKTIIPQLHSLKFDSVSYECLAESVDILEIILSRCSLGSVANLEQIQNFIVPFLTFSRPSIRKKAAMAFGALSSHLDTNALIQTIDHVLLKPLLDNPSSEEVKSFIYAFGIIARLNGRKIAAFYPQLLNAIEKILSNYGDEENDELKETCLQTIELMIYGNSKCLENQIVLLMKMSACCLKHDPNYSFAMDEEGIESDQGEEDTSMEEYEEENEFEDDFTDDEDTSWKVRRAAAKLLKTIIEAYPLHVNDIFKTSASSLIEKFIEREPIVQLDILSAFTALLKVINSTSDFFQEYEQQQTTSYLKTSKNNSKRRRTAPSITRKAKEDEHRMDTTDDGLDQSVVLLKNSLPILLKSISKCISQKDRKYSASLSACYKILLNTLYIVQYEMDSYIPPILKLSSQLIANDLNQNTTGHRNMALKLDIIVFLRLALRKISISSLQPHAQQLVEIICPLVKNDSYHQVVIEGLKFLRDLVEVVRPTSPASSPVAATAPVLLQKLPFILKSIFETCWARAAASDADTEVKEAALDVLGELWSKAGDILVAQNLITKSLYSLILERLENEPNRLATLNALIKISSSRLDHNSINLIPILSRLIELISSFFRKENRSLRIASLTLLTLLVERYPENFTDDSFNTSLIPDFKILVSDSDMPVLALAAKTFCVILRQLPPSIHSAMHKSWKNGILMDLLNLVNKPVVADCQNTQQEIIRLVSTWLSVYPTDFSDFVKSYLEPFDALSVDADLPSVKAINPSLNHNPIIFRARCISAALNMCKSIPQSFELSQKFQNIVRNATERKCEPLIALSILVISTTEQSPELFQNILSIINRQNGKESEDLRTLAAYAAGNMGLANLNEFMPVIVSQLQNTEDAQSKKSLFLCLNRLISGHLNHLYSASVESLHVKEGNTNELKPFVESLWELIVNISTKSSEDQGENGNLTIAAECLGNLAMIDPVTCLSNLQGNLKSDSYQIRILTVMSIKFAFSEHQDKPFEAVTQLSDFEELLKPLIIDMLGLIGTDNDIHVLKCIFMALNNLIHHKPYLIRDQFTSLIPRIVQETRIREELIHIVEMGPFKHRVDNGLDVRKVAYECIYTAMGSPLLISRLDQSKLLETIILALADPAQEIQALVHLMLIKWCKQSSLSGMESLVAMSTAVLQNQVVMDAIVSSTKSIVLTPPKDNAVKQEVQKQLELSQSGLKAFYMFSKILGLITDIDKGAKVIIGSIDGGNGSLKPILDLWIEMNNSARIQPMLSDLASEISQGTF